MLKNILKKAFKNIIDKHVDIAVKKAEDIIGNGRGEEKKAMAVAYVMSFIKLPVPLCFLKPFINGALVSIVDKAVEVAVDKLHQIQNRLMAG